MKPLAVVLLSGGLASSTVAAIAIADGYEVIGLSFRYGQRHERELTAASSIASSLGITEHFIVDINLGQWGGSALTERAIAVPTDGVKTGVIPPTYVSGRNERVYCTRSVTC